MLAIPAIDLMGGKAVRLKEGDPRRATVYADDPRAALKDFLAKGARRVHVVDLDGAFSGRPVQTDLVRELVAIAHTGGAEIEVGGGLRDASAVVSVLDTGADYAVVGTLAVRDPGTAAQLCREHPQRIVVAIDERDGLVSLAGWQERTAVPALALAKSAAIWGAAALLHTDISRDGLQVGPAVETTAALQRAVPGVLVIASGGVGTLADLDALRAADIRAVVLGRALYEGSFTLEEALARC